MHKLQSRVFEPWPLKFCLARPGQVEYHSCTHETYRVNYQTLDRLRFTLPIIHNTVHNFLSQGSIRMTKHVSDRLKQYIGAISRCGTYTELYQDEWLHLQKITSWFPDLVKTRQYKLVQVGWNSSGEICKLGLVMPLFNRCLFMCIGADYGIKTLYVTPSFKNRSKYREPPEVTVLDFNDLSQLLVSSKSDLGKENN